MNVRDLNETTARAMLDAVGEICDYTERRMSEFVRDGIDDADVEHREDVEYELLMPAYRHFSDLFGELQTYIRFLETGCPGCEKELKK